MFRRPNNWSRTLRVCVRACVASDSLAEPSSRSTPGLVTGSAGAVYLVYGRRVYTYTFQFLLIFFFVRFLDVYSKKPRTWFLVLIIYILPTILQIRLYFYKLCKMISHKRVSLQINTNLIRHPSEYTVYKYANYPLKHNKWWLHFFSSFYTVIFVMVLRTSRDFVFFIVVLKFFPLSILLLLLCISL